MKTMKLINKCTESKRADARICGKAKRVSFVEEKDLEFNPVTLDIDDEIKKASKDPEWRKADEQLRNSFIVIETMLKAKAISKQTQSEIAEKMGTKQAAISRILSKKHEPNLKTFFYFLHANNVRIKRIELEKEPDLVTQ